VPGSDRTAREPADVDIEYVAPRHFETIGSVPVLGREFDRNDTATSRKVAVVDEAFVRAFLPGEAHPLGRTLSFDGNKPEGGAPADGNKNQAARMLGLTRNALRYRLTQMGLEV
jgi:hypothetical protein